METRRSKRRTEDTPSAKNEVNVPAKKTKSDRTAATKAAATTKTPKKSSSDQRTEETTPKDQNVNGNKADRTSVWLMKSEPDTFSIDDLIKSKDSTSQWDGVVTNQLLFFFFLLFCL